MKTTATEQLANLINTLDAEQLNVAIEIARAMLRHNAPQEETGKAIEAIGRDYNAGVISSETAMQMLRQI